LQQFHPHYDGRFADKVLPEAERIIALKALLRAYLSTMNDIGAETWIMHGSLLGWWWNRKIMPWDSDVDVQISERSIAHLARYYNMTIHHFQFAELAGGESITIRRTSTTAATVANSTASATSTPTPTPSTVASTYQGRDYMLEINPNWVNPSVLDHYNMIDARWIDTETGLFIDITTLRRDVEAEQRGYPGRMMCKDRHHYLEEDVFPLRESVFENVPVKIPFAYSELLIEEYGAQCLTATEFEGHRFDEQKMEWERIE